MKRLLLLFMLAIISEGITAQTNPTPWDLKDSHYEWFNMDDPTSSDFPPSMQGWLASYAWFPPVVSTTLQATGDAVLCDTCVFDDVSMNNETERGISLYADGTGANKPIILAMALNTTDCFGIKFSWNGETRTNLPTASDGIQLQYRVGESGDWNNLLNQEYRDLMASQFFMNKAFHLTLPDETNNKPVVQLRWLLFSNDNVVPLDRLAVLGVYAEPDSIANENIKDYCKASGVGCSGVQSEEIFINEFNINADGADFINTSGCQMYSEFTDLDIPVTAGLSYKAGIMANTCLTNGYGAIWADWNNDFDFEDENEVIYAKSSTWVGGVTSCYTFDLNIPANVEGKIRMRIGLSEFYNPLPCGPRGHGDVEDYTLNVIPAKVTPNCAALASPADNETDLCTGSQLFTWNKSTGDPDGYAFYLGTDNPPTTIHDSTDVATDTSYVNIKPLAANTTYFWRVSAYNVFGESTGCDVFQFTTAANVDPSITQILIEGNNIDSTGACINEDLLITANISGGSGTVNYAWTGGDIYLDNNPSNNPTFNTANNPTFTSTDANKTYPLRLTVTDVNGCSARDSVKIFVKDNPTPGTLSADKTSVCPDEDVTLTLTGYTDNIQDWEQEIVGGSYASIGNINDLHTTTISDDTKFKVLVEKDGCVAESNELTITLKAAPLTPIINVSPGNSVCEGETITLTATPETDIVWNDAGSSTTNPIDVTSDGTFNVTYTDPTTNCSATSTDEMLTFSALPADPIITATGDLCSGSTVELSTQYTGVSWDLNGTGTANTDAIDVMIDGTYGVTYTDPTTNCTSVSSENIVFSAKPNAPVIEQKGDSLITNPLQLVDWLDADGNVVHTGDSYSPDRTADQTFTAVVIDGNDCASDESNEVAYDHTISILSYALVRFDVFPNPATDELNIVVHAATSAGVYQLKDMTGRTIKQVILFEGQSVVSITDIDSGVYLLQHESGSAVRVVKQ